MTGLFDADDSFWAALFASRSGKCQMAILFT